MGIMQKQMTALKINLDQLKCPEKTEHCTVYKEIIQIQCTKYFIQYTRH